MCSCLAHKTDSDSNEDKISTDSVVRTREIASPINYLNQVGNTLTSPRLFQSEDPELCQEVFLPNDDSVNLWPFIIMLYWITIVKSLDTEKRIGAYDKYFL